MRVPASGLQSYQAVPWGSPLPRGSLGRPTAIRSASNGEDRRLAEPRSPEPPPGPDSSESLRLVLVEDHALVRAGVRSLLESLPGAMVVGEAEDGVEALRIIADALPDIVFLDISMPLRGGIETLQRIRMEYPSVRVIILSIHDDEEYVTRALALGASGYLLKTSDRTELELAIRAVARGGMYLTPSVAGKAFGRPAARDPGAGGRRVPLSPRQQSVARLIGMGHTNREIARELGLSIKTVESHRSELMARLGVHEAAGIIRYALRSGLLNDDD